MINSTIDSSFDSALKSEIAGQYHPDDRLTYYLIRFKNTPHFDPVNYRLKDDRCTQMSTNI